MIQVNSKEEAIEWASRCPASANETIEIRQVQEFEDFPEDVQQVVDKFPEVANTTTAGNTHATHEAQIRQLIGNQQRAICTKDVDQIMSHYADEVILFDVKPPFQTIGKEAVRQLWKDCLPYFPNSFEMETRDLTIAVNDSLATAHWLFHFKGEPDHPAMQMWMRATAICQKHQGEWQILHEHISVPFNPETSQAVLTLNS
ncbi:MAG: nuclear transport factor 2 family protein [Drouetiella hepatica Uher 2000/2452]|uniref:Nuclear transport factor 2 family protein n=1 Tax=Drouetiella hepatica Uher 2000/2452 TaxID=904376 RepID=A0A951UR73_9CYAN|nr:nuclear transport factor 2 family protein [Drouetiella hepatica Uher 2000/2452]